MEQRKLMQPLTFEQKVIWVKGLAIDCPMREAVETCPAKDLRKLPVEERIEIVTSMSEEQIDDVIAKHEACLCRREE